MTTISLDNRKKNDSVKWKQVADIALYSLPLLTTAVLTTPLSDSSQKWILTIINIAIVGFKAFSKFTTDEENTNININTSPSVVVNSNIQTS